MSRLSGTITGITDNSQEKQRIWTVSELAKEFSFRLEKAFPPLWVKAEISGSRRHSSGHYYLTLKDKGAVFSAVFWKGRASRSKTLPQDGMQVEALVKLVYYAPGGRLQLDIQQLRSAGLGDLMQTFILLREKLLAAGLFESAIKKKIPAFPQKVGLLTSESGAALQDMLKIFRRRFPPIKLILCPVAVQGASAGAELVAGLKRLQRVPDLDLIIMGRGGGSFEDLFCFNDENLAWAINTCHVPVISAVGHEIDTTISDLAADLRAPTPSAAAELAVPDIAELLARLEELKLRSKSAMQIKVNNASRELDALFSHRALSQPLRHLADFRQRVDEQLQRIHSMLTNSLKLHQSELPLFRRSLEISLKRKQSKTAEQLRGYPLKLRTLLGRQIGLEKDRLRLVHERFEYLLRQVLAAEKQKLGFLEQRLGRCKVEKMKEMAWRLGFVHCTDGNGKSLQSISALSIEQKVNLEFLDGIANARIESIGGENEKTK
jgi:exodeoxyribonuclease VII large subunit